MDVRFATALFYFRYVRNICIMGIDENRKGSYTIKQNVCFELNINKKGKVAGISHISLYQSALELMSDPATDRRLLPSCFRTGDNARKIKHYKIALKNAINNCISSAQREQLELYYQQGLTKSEIAKKQNKGCSAITKSMRAGQESIRAYVELYMEIYDALEQEWLREEGLE